MYACESSATPLPSLSGTPRRSSMQMLIRNWCIAGGFKVMTSQGGTLTIKYSNPHWQCSFCSTMWLEMHLQAKIVCHTTRINSWDKQKRMLRIHQSKFGEFQILNYCVIALISKGLETLLFEGATAASKLVLSLSTVLRMCKCKYCFATYDELD